MRLFSPGEFADCAGPFVGKPLSSGLYLLQT